MSSSKITVRGARQNNLKNVDISLPLHSLTVVTGVSGSGKSSLAFDTIYAEGQRRYVETFSPYARQFLDRMDKPAVDQIDGIPPAIAIDQTNPVRTSRSTVGTMTELNDHLKLLFARAATLFCDGCGEVVREDNPDSIWQAILETFDGHRVAIAFEHAVPAAFKVDEVKRFLSQQGYTRFLTEDADRLQVIQDRVRLAVDKKSRVIESIEAALKRGDGFVQIASLDDDRERRFSTRLHCASCDRTFREPTPSLFSFNSPLGACETCRGFGRTMGIDDDLVIPDHSLSLSDGAIKPIQSKSYSDLQERLLARAAKNAVRIDVPYRDLSAAERRFVREGEGRMRDGLWPGIQRIFDWLESKAYKMHVRVMLSRYRSYETCRDCNGARLKVAGLRWRLRGGEPLETLNMHELMLLPIRRLRTFMAHLELPSMTDKAVSQLLSEINTRIGFLADTGLGYLTLDRQSRTLSGGEVQRINLTTALGTSLVNTLFVLDEPSIGLHPRDISRINDVLLKLRDAGNTLLVVEHDPQIMRVADRIVDIGPGPGERGGKVVFEGSLKALAKSSQSPTAPYLTGQQRVADARRQRRTIDPKRRVGVRGASANNLKQIDVDFPLNALVTVTGVSGSGKSTLTGDILYPALSRKLGATGEQPGMHQRVVGAGLIDEIIFVDQKPIGKTTRSNPASFVGAFDAIRKLFTEQPLAIERGYKPGTFSFNSGDGRCPTCGGNGFEHVEMQFLSDVYLRCPDCDGKRFRDEVLEVRVWPASGGHSHSIADVLALTVNEALNFFSDQPAICKVLAPLVAVGLDYLKLGQPVPTLSGGEAQRLKLAKFLGQSASADGEKGKLFLFDEPTTGLHFQDIEQLLGAFDQLLDDGHSVIVIEHNLDVIDAADWIIDLGPEGGELGGELLFAGTSEALLELSDNATALALRDYRGAGSALQAAAETAGRYEVRDRVGKVALQDITISKAREHNLRNIDLTIPRNRFTAITGVSGSGKSTIAFDILFNEGQRRYLESLNAYARQFVQPASRPDVDAVSGIPPTVAIEQRTSRGGRKSTVGTMTEVYHFLRLLFVKLGTAYCPDCEVAIAPQSEAQIADALLRERRGKRIRLLAPLVVARKGYYTDLAKWAGRKDFQTLRVDGEDQPVDPWPRLDRFREHDIELPVGEMTVEPGNAARLRSLLSQAVDFGKGLVIVEDAGSGKRRRKDQLFSTKRACPSCSRSFAELDPRLFSYNSAHGWCSQCHGSGLASNDLTDSESDQVAPCPACSGQRLNAVALAVRFHKRTITDYTDLPISRALEVFRELGLAGRDAEIARDVLSELESRLRFLKQVGLGYLALSRAAPTLSGGEAQRIRLASQLGSNLRGVCYILDEPTIGLHPRDNGRLLATLKALQASGNTVVVVEHDEDTIRGAQHIIDIGPGAGVRGGEVVATGSVKNIMRNRRSLTGKMLREPLAHPLREAVRDVNPRRRDAHALAVKKAVLNNLKQISVRLPLGALVAVSGVSGSGKSSLIRGVVEDNVARLVASQQRRGRKIPDVQGCQAIEGWQTIRRVLEVDQTPIGKTPRSCPATYIGFWDDIRKLFAATPEARIRGYTASRFSFNTKEGRCPECDGQGMRRIEMSFMPDVQVPCETCRGARFTPETLAIRYRDKHVGEVLNMEVEDAVAFFAAHPKIHHALCLLRDVGLGYLTLGQPSPTLSGGEAQRIKLVSELAKARPTAGEPVRSAAENPQHTLYILDEPTIGLHMADVARLIGVLQRLVDAGHSIYIIEHNLDILAEADWLIDLGPEGGDQGGRIVWQGVPSQIPEKNEKSYTLAALRPFLVRTKD